MALHMRPARRPTGEQDRLRPHLDQIVDLSQTPAGETWVAYQLVFSQATLGPTMTVRERNSIKLN
jgi:hypothetical protein